MILAALTAGAISIAPPINPTCAALGDRLLLAVASKQITNQQAAFAFHTCQVQHAPLSPL